MDFYVIYPRFLGLIGNYKYIMITDGDLTCESSEWLQEQISILNNDDIFCCAIDLLSENLPLKTFPESQYWIPSHEPTDNNYIESFTGVHLLLFRTENFLGVLKYLKLEDQRFTDMNMYHYCCNIINKKWVKTKNIKAYHLTWDVYADLNHPYTIEKNIIYNNQELVNKWCGYTISSLDKNNMIKENRKEVG